MLRENVEHEVYCPGHTEEVFDPSTDEEADLTIRFTRTHGLTPLRLVLSSSSITARRAARAARREKRELEKRGY